eukprot:666943-Hanusia_phi.AAC.3
MYLTHSDGVTRVPIGSGERISDLEVFAIAHPYLKKDLRVHFECGQSVRVYCEEELKIIARMLTAYYNYEVDQDDGLDDPFFKGAQWNSSLFSFYPDGAGLIPSDSDQARSLPVCEVDNMLLPSEFEPVFIPKLKTGLKRRDDTFGPIGGGRGRCASGDGPGERQACGHNAAGRPGQGEADEGQAAGA